MLILNENKFAETLLSDGLADCSPHTAIALLARYYRHTLGYKKKQIREAIIDYLEKYYPRYEIEQFDWIEYVEKITMRSRRLPVPFVSDGIRITKSEIDTIDNIKNETLARLCFTMLCVAKLNDQKNKNNNGWVNLDDRELFRLARVTCKSGDRDVKIGRLQRMGLLEFPKKNDNLNFRVTFINDADDEALFITDVRELGYEYMSYKGGGFIRCQECGRLTKSNKAGTKKYCENCAAYSPAGTKTVVCADCGKSFVISAKNNRSCRCDECRTTYRRNYYKKMKQTQRSAT